MERNYIGLSGRTQLERDVDDYQGKYKRDGRGMCNCCENMFDNEDLNEDGMCERCIEKRNEIE